MDLRAILILQGGGALGAYECGVYKALAPYLKKHKQVLTVVAGTSIGAINASIIASQYNTEDQGFPILKKFWKEVLAIPSSGFFPSDEERRWNAVWRSILYGHPRLFTPLLPGWNFFPPISWYPFTHFYDTQAMEQTLAKYFNSYGPRATEPRLIVTAVDVKEGTHTSFDSLKEHITPGHVVASASLPPWFPAKSLDGKFYWDGGLWTNTPLRDALNALQDDGTTSEKLEEYQVYIVHLFPQQGSLPKTYWEVGGRINEIIYEDKTEYDNKACSLVNRYIDFVKDLHELSSTLPLSIKQRIDKEYRHIRNEKRVHLTITQIGRSALPYEHISREIDFSQDRIEKLIDQGERDAKAALEKGMKG